MHTGPYPNRMPSGRLNFTAVFPIPCPYPLNTNAIPHSVSKKAQKNLFVHIGTLDFRRRMDFESFLRASWPKIRAAAPQASVNFVGDLVGSPIQVPGATYTGPVKDDAEAYRHGRFALNFQNTNGGIKLKTLTSLAAGRTLISTPRGVEGFPLDAGTHFWDMTSFLSADHLSQVMQDGEQCRRLGQAGREYVIEKHSRAAIAENFASLLEAAHENPLAQDDLLAPADLCPGMEHGTVFLFDVGRYSFPLILFAGLPFCLCITYRSLVSLALPIASSIFAVAVGLLQGVRDEPYPFAGRVAGPGHCGCRRSSRDRLARNSPPKSKLPS